MQYIDYFGFGLHQLVYTSRMARPMDAQEIDLIVNRSNRANDAKAVSGALLVYGDIFIQVLEGDHASVKSLFQRIEADPRHTDVVLKGVEPLERRHFERWGMRRGRPPSEGGMNLAALRGPDLVTMVRLSTGRRRVKAA